MNQEPLYENKELKIVYLLNSPEDHELLMKNSEDSYILPRGTLKELATCRPHQFHEKLERVIGKNNLNAIFSGKDAVKTFVCLFSSFQEAYNEEERRITSFINQNSQ